MSTRLCALLAVTFALLGAGLRLWLPVEPVDDAFRDVIRFYQSLERS